MSWLARSIVNGFKPDNSDDFEENDDGKQYSVHNNTFDYLRQSPGKGVKQDLSEISKTLTRPFWGVASLIAFNERSESSETEAIAGIRRDFAEIGGRFRSGILKVSDFLQAESDDDDEDSSDGDGNIVGVSDEVVAFADNIAMHPETWLEFPLPENEDDGEDFDLSDAQQEHVLAVERLAPRLSALRVELCPNYMSESLFWKIYFLLLHPILDREAIELLSTPNIMKARALMSHELNNRSYSESTSDSKSKEVSAIETVKYSVKSDDIQIVDKSVIQEESHEGKDEDDWLKRSSSEIVTNIVAIPIEGDDDVSFSDLDDDDDDDGNIPIYYKNATYTVDSSTKVKKIGASDSLRLVSVRNSETK